jgi:hypothetical protein
VAVVGAGLVALFACGSPATAGRHPSARPSQVSTPTPAHGVPSPAPASPPASAAPTPASTPAATTLIPQHDQSLTLSGAVTGTVAGAEIKECGTGNGGWALELSSMTVEGGTASLTLLVTDYHGAGSYRPSGALNAIENQQLMTFPVTGGAVDIAGGGTSGQMDLKLTSSTDQPVQIQGTWACA